MRRSVSIPLAVSLALAFVCALVWTLRSGPPREPQLGRAAARCPGCSVLIVVLDAARADHFGCYGYRRPTTPNIDKLALEGVVFERAISDASWTIPSIASLLSGFPPVHHGVVRSGGVLPEAITTLAEVLTERGYRTAAFTENPLIDPDYGFGQGFQHFRQYVERSARGKAPSQGEEFDLSRSREHVTEMVEWIDSGADDSPFLLYVHLLRPHNPYHALPEHTGSFSSTYSGGLTGGTREIHSLQLRSADLSEGDLQHLVDLYDENLLSADALTGDLIDALRRRRLLESTITVLLSDHGEGFREHGTLLHGLQVYQESIHIPFIIRFPQPAAVEPRREGALVQLTDVMPTLLAALGMDEGEESGGWNLMPLLTGRREARREQPVVAHGATATSLQEDSLKFILLVASGDGTPARGQLFDLSVDPLESRDIASERAGKAQSMRTLLEAELEEQRGHGVAPTSEDLNPALIERLIALGYLGEEAAVSADEK